MFYVRGDLVRSDFLVFLFSQHCIIMSKIIKNVFWLKTFIKQYYPLHSCNKTGNMRLCQHLFFIWHREIFRMLAKIIISILQHTYQHVINKGLVFQFHFCRGKLFRHCIIVDQKFYTFDIFWISSERNMLMFVICKV
jgi:hypothetical protein